MIFSDPVSVAVVGASDDPAKWGHWLARGALAGRGRRAVHLVNRGGGAVLSQPTVRTLSELPEAPELVVLAVPAVHVAAVVDEALALGTRGFVGIPSTIEDRVIARIRAAGARLLGPNCLGVYDAATSLHLAWGRFQPGSLGVVSQSGQVGLEIAGLAGAAGLGVSRFVSVGNQVDVTAAEALLELVSHEMTTVVGVYLESFGPGILTALSELRSAGKPVVLLTVGGSTASREAAFSHTGALTSTLDVVDAACRRTGALRVATPAALVDLAAVVTHGVPRGRRVGILADSGGQGAIAADLAVAAGLTVPALSAVAGLPEGASTRNPVDLAGAGEQDLANYARAVEVLVRGGDVDSVVLSGYFGSYGADTPSLEPVEVAVADRICSLARETGVPVVAHSMCVDSAAVRALRAGGVAVQHTIERVVGALGDAARFGSLSPGLVAAFGGPELSVLSERMKAGDPLEGDPCASTPSTPGVPFRPGYLAARELLDFVRFPEAHPVTSAEEARATTLNGPFALKADWLLHKSEHGGVQINLTDPAAAFEAMEARLGPGTYVLEEMDTREHTVELIVGAKRDHSFGPVILVGVGGVHAELYQDTAVELAPVTPATAEAMLDRLKVAPLLKGRRGAQPLDLTALAQVVAALSCLITTRHDLAEIELNPVRVGPDGVLAVDALIIPAPETTNDASGQRVA
ncbi:acetate--CoA ligase family protein [Nocardia sp. NRRL S-836]|uniref:acetate--CoA ligase family protein n=1 Tax=Nocardia sp. NRRL S-836 TaxID=1519492 RepID=UPI000ABB66C1|nr:acetate--CoA ligase family protein [Nocardia sp. NRRL S-836]